MNNTNSDKIYKKMFPGTYEKREKLMSSLASINLKYKKPSFLNNLEIDSSSKELNQ